MTHPPASDSSALATTTPPVAIRRAAPADAADVAAMVGEIAAHEDQSAHVHVDVEQWRRLLHRRDVILLLAEHAGQAVGYVSALRQLHLWTGDDVLDLDDLYVRPGHRDAGVGRQLMAALAALAAPDQLLIRWGMEVDNADAQRFYPRLGAILRPKVLAAWTPGAYRHLASARPLPEDR
ncbi:N-acetyltransferase family protein [Blastococcus sp. SYSU DS0539]